MAKTIKLPGIGAVPSRYVMWGGLAVAGIAGFFWWRYLNAPPAAEDEPATADYTEGGEYVYGDPGMAYGADYAYDGGAYPYPTYTTPAYGTNTTVQTPNPVTNSEWTQRAIEHLENVGIESREASLSVSRYLLKECVTAPQSDIVRQAVAAIGPPPQGTFSILVCPGAPPAPGPGTPGAGPLPAPGRIFATSATRSSIRFGWDRVPGATRYVVQQTGANGAWQTIGHSADNQHTRSGLSRGRQHRFRVAGIDAAGRTGRFSATLTRATQR